ncbi:MAG: cupin domain-containing protein [Pirellulaceae bacterium]
MIRRPRSPCWPQRRRAWRQNHLDVNLRQFRFCNRLLPHLSAILRCRMGTTRIPIPPLPPSSSTMTTQWMTEMIWKSRLSTTRRRKPGRRIRPSPRPCATWPWQPRLLCWRATVPFRRGSERGPGPVRRSGWPRFERTKSRFGCGSPREPPCWRWLFSSCGYSRSDRLGATPSIGSAKVRHIGRSKREKEMTKTIVDRQDCSHYQIFPGVEIFTTAGDNIMLSVVEFEPHSVVEAHRHPHEQMGLLLEGELTFTIGGETRLVKAGQMWRIPGGVEHSVTAGDQPAKALDVFHPVREDYR